MYSGDEVYDDEVTSGPIVPTMSQPLNECPDCGHANHDPEQGRCSVIWMGERCDCGGSDCTHDHIERDDDGISRRFFVCIDCDQEVRYDGPDEDGRVVWEVVE